SWVRDRLEASTCASTARASGVTWDKTPTPGRDFAAKRAAFHEAGHIVQALLEWHDPEPIKGVAIFVNGAGCSHIVDPAWAAPESRLRVYLAGRAAESRFIADWNAIAWNPIQPYARFRGSPDCDDVERFLGYRFTDDEICLLSSSAYDGL